MSYETLQTLDALHALYGTPGESSTRKVAGRITPGYRQWIERAKFCALTTVGPEGTDCSPRGDDGPVVQIMDDQTLALPDWRGNNRIDSLRNVVRDPRVTLMLMVPGSANVVRINGQGAVSADPTLLGQFDRKGAQPRSVILIRIEEIYFQCARALIRSGLWAGQDQSVGLPTPGTLLAEMTDGAIDGTAYDADWPDRAKASMW